MVGSDAGDNDSGDECPPKNSEKGNGQNRHAKTQNRESDAREKRASNTKEDPVDCPKINHVRFDGHFAHLHLVSKASIANIIYFVKYEFGTKAAAGLV